MPASDNQQPEESINAFSPELLDVDGFRFLTKQDADKAKIDAEKIGVLEAHLAQPSANALYAIYEKSIQNKIFATPVGWTFLQNIRNRLLELGVKENALLPIPMTTTFTRPPVTPAPAPHPEPVKEEKKEKPRRRKEERRRTPLLILSAVLNLVLIGLVIAMFVVLSYGETTNMLNYKEKYTNEYAIMKQELQQEIQDKKTELLKRERAVADKERALGMENQTETGGDTND